jgi:hypothetical protein
MNFHTRIFTIWIFYVTIMVIAGWTLSAFHAYSSMGIFGGLVVCACLVHGYRSWKKTSETSQREFLDDLSFPPFLILLSLISLAGILYRSTVLDSLSYRIPRMLMWLQEDRVLFIDNPDARLNFMTPLWEFASTPVFLAFGFHSLWVGSALSWIMLYLASIKISSEFTTNRNTCRWLAMIPCSTSHLRGTGCEWHGSLPHRKLQTSLRCFRIALAGMVFHPPIAPMAPHALEMVASFVTCRMRMFTTADIRLKLHPLRKFQRASGRWWIRPWTVVFEHDLGQRNDALADVPNACQSCRRHDQPSNRATYRYLRLRSNRAAFQTCR